MASSAAAFPQASSSRPVPSSTRVASSSRGAGAADDDEEDKEDSPRRDARAAPGPGSAASAPKVTPTLRTAASAEWSEEQMRLVWDSVTRSLLRLGSGGAQPSHSSALRSLLAAHTLVKVQLNGNPARIISAANEVAAGADAQLLAQKGRTLLYAPIGMDLGALLTGAEDSMVKIARYHEKAKARSDATRQLRDAQREVREGKALRDQLSRRNTGFLDAGDDDDEEAPAPRARSPRTSSAPPSAPRQQSAAAPRKQPPPRQRVAPFPVAAAPGPGTLRRSAPVMDGGGPGGGARTPSPPPRVPSGRGGAAAKRTAKAPWRQGLQERQDELQVDQK